MEVAIEIQAWKRSSALGKFSYVSSISGRWWSNLFLNMPNESHSLICWEIKRDHCENLFWFNPSPHALHKPKHFPSHRAALGGCSSTFRKVPNLSVHWTQQVLQPSHCWQIIICTVTNSGTVCKKSPGRQPYSVGGDTTGRAGQAASQRVAKWKGPGQASTQEKPLNNKVEARKITAE